MPTYLDYNATTPMDSRVFDAMKPYFLEEFGNAGSRNHVYGQRAKEAVEKARDQVASLVGAKPEEVIFTSGATESNNLALLGLAAWGENQGKRHIVSTTIEHKAVLEPLEYLHSQGFKVDLVEVDKTGAVETEAVLQKLRADTLVVSVMHANNETGVLQPIREIGTALRERGIWFHTDAAQTYGKEVEELRLTPCDFTSISAHKFYGPKGIGALVARRTGTQKRPLTPILRGGGQELGLRSGTAPVPLIVGLGEAARLARLEYKTRRKEAQSIKDKILSVLQSVPHTINGKASRIQSHVLNVAFDGVDSEALMMALREEFAISNGSACTSSTYKPSHVLKAMGIDEDVIQCSIRLSWGAGVKPDDLPFERFIDVVYSLN